MPKRPNFWDSPYSPPKRAQSWIRPPYSPEFSRMVHDVGSQIGSSIVNNLTGGFTRTGTQSNRTQEVTRRVRGQRAYLAGKVRPKKKTSRKLSYKVRKGKKRGKRMSTRLGLQSYGVHATSELRWTTKTDTADKYESIQVGHNSMPTRPVLINCCRAIVKHLFRKKRINSFTDVITIDPYNFSVGDVITISYFADYTSNVVSSFDISFAAGQTFENIAVAMFSLLTSSIGGVVMKNLRFLHIQYKPLGGSWNEPIMLDLTGAEFEVSVKSSLKVQNRTINSVGNDEADDVDNVPLTGYLYHMKGNNMWNRSHKAGLKAVGSGATASNDVVLFSAYTKSTGIAAISADGEYVQINNDNSTFNKQSEPPKPYDIFNCTKSSKLRINPGGIKTSVLTQKYKLDFTYLLKLLLDDPNASPDLTQCYNSRKGFCRVMHLEKVIGSDLTSVALGVENQFDIWTRVISKPESKYTGAVQVQTDIGVFP